MITADLLIELAWKSLLVGGVVLGLLKLARQRSAAERSWIAHCGLAALLLLVPAVILAPAWNPVPLPQLAIEPVTVAPVEVKLPELAHANSPPAVEVASAPAAAGADWALPAAGELAVWAYALPAMLLLIAMFIAVARLFAMHRRANVLVEAPWLAALAQAQRRMGFKHGTALLVSDELHSPVSWGMMRPIILLNPGVIDATDEAEAIIAHELAHVARLDWAKLLLSRAACAVFWFNPLVWMLARESHQLREEAADDAVLLSDVDGTDYASLLVNAARHDNQALLLAAHGVAPAKDSLKRRITRVLDASLPRRPADMGWIALCLVVVIGVAGPLAALDPMSKPVEEPEVLALTEQPKGLGGIVAGVIADTVPGVIRGTLTGNEPADLAADEERDALHDTSEDGEGNSEADRLIEMKAVGLSESYIREMTAAGFGGNVDDMVEARAVGVTPEFARQMRQYSPTVDLDDVVEAKAVGLSPQFIGEMRAVFPGMDLDNAVEFAALGVTPDYVQQMRRLFPNVTADQIVEMKAVGVTPAFVEEMRREGLSARQPDEAVEGRLFGQMSRDRDDEG
jgi:bla regulator protein blaR1